MKLLTTIILLTICFTATAQTFSSKKSLTFYPGTYIDTEARYTDPTGINLIIQNSLPKWGTSLLDSTRRKEGFSSLIFFNRIINETNAAIELIIDFTSDSLPSDESPGAYLKIFLPSDTMTLEKEVAYSYGLTSLASLFDRGAGKPTILHKTIDPRQDYLFYVVLFFYQPKTQQHHETGTRAGFELDAQSLFYKVNQPGFASIPCGKIVLKKS